MDVSELLQERGGCACVRRLDARARCPLEHPLDASVERVARRGEPAVARTLPRLDEKRFETPAKVAPIADARAHAVLVEARGGDIAEQHEQLDVAGGVQGAVRGQLLTVERI